MTKLAAILADIRYGQLRYIEHNRISRAVR